MDNLILIIENLLNEAFDQNNIIFKAKITKCRIAGYDYSLSNIHQIAKSNNCSIEKIKDFLCTKFNNNNLFEICTINNHVNFKIKDCIILNTVEKILNTNCIFNIQEFEPLLVGTKDESISNLIFQQNNKKKIIVDYSSPNIAKDMHVGHLRSTIIGDCIANLYEKLGHNVSRINHIGDFGLPFGMIIQYIINNKLENNIDSLNLQEIYKLSRTNYESDEIFKREAYLRTVELQKDLDQNTHNIWKQICDCSKKSYMEIYEKLNINLIEKGESFYKFMFDDLVEELKNKNLLQNDNGRFIILTQIDNQIDVPLTIIKSDGGYTYDTTDLCAIKYRLTVENADKIFYVVDSGQSTHFKQVFYIAEKMGWKKPNQHLEHINFGVVLGTDRKRLKSRNGDNPKLIDLLNESFERTKDIMKIKKSENVSNDEYIKNLAYGSIKYCDLSLNRISDYIFSFDKMINFTGNTLAFCMYAYARCCSIIKNVEKYNIKYNVKCENSMKHNELIEKDYIILKTILRLPEFIQQTLLNNTPHIICEYIYNLSEIIHNSYKTLKCITYNDDESVNINFSRVNMYRLIIQIYNFSFDILGIIPIDHM